MQEKLVNLFNSALSGDVLDITNLQKRIAEIVGRDTRVSRNNGKLNINISVPWLLAPVVKKSLDPDKIGQLLASNGSACSCIKTSSGIEINLEKPKLEISQINVVLG